MKTEVNLLQRSLASSIAELQRTIQMADTKANIILVLIGVIISLFFNFFVSKDIIPVWQVMTVLILFSIAGAFSLSTLYPRISKKSGKFSIQYYKDIMDMNIQKTMKDFSQKSCDESLIEDYLHSLKALSNIVNKKFSKLRIAYIFFALAVITKIIFESSFWLSL